MKVDCIDSMKFNRTKRKLRADIECPSIDVATILAGLLVRLWQLTARNAPRGNVGKFTNEEIVEAIGWLGDADRLIEILLADGWLEPHSTERLIVHDWAEHCPNYVKGNAERMGGFIKSELPRNDTPKELPKEPPTGPPEAPPNDQPNDPPNAEPKEGPTYSIPTQPIQTSSSHADADSKEEGEEIFEALKSRGITKARACQQAANECGLSPSEIKTIIAEFDSMPIGCWDNPPGVLFARLTGQLTQLPPFSDAFESQKRRQESQCLAAQASQANQNAVSARQHETRLFEDLESQFGHIVNALSTDEQNALLAELYPTEQDRAFLRNKQRRQDLLEQVSRRQLNGAAIV
jgi:hypothetical protein